jgi:hypothetical protein
MSNPDDQSAHPGYETSDAHAGLVWIVAAGLVVSVGLIIFGSSVLYGYLHRRELGGQNRTAVNRVTTAVGAARAQFPEPRLQTAPQVDLAAMRAREDAELNTYGWVDRQAGVVRLPIEKAMDLVLQHHLPARGDPDAPKPTRTPLDMQIQRPLQREPGKETP